MSATNTTTPAGGDSGNVPLSNAPQPPGGCTTHEALAKKHASDAAFVDSKVAMMKKPRLGKPVPSASVELQATAMKEELAKKIEAEKQALEEYLTYKAAHPDPVAGSSSSAAVSGPASASAGAANDSDGEDNDEEGPSDGPKKSKAQRRRERKAAEKAATEAAIDAAVKAYSDTVPSSSVGRVVSLGGVSGNTALKEVELAALESKLKPLNLSVHLVAADGNCLFRAAADQLMRMGGGQAGAGAGGDSGGDYLSLRRRAATYIRLHALEFAPFLPYEPADGYPEDEPNNETKVKAAVDKYCQRLSSTSAWGGHPELRALASTLGVPIMVYQAEGDAWRLAPDNEEGEGDAMVKGGGGLKRRGDDGEGVLRLSFHRHYYALGEHYNSVISSSSTARSGPR